MEPKIFTIFKNSFVHVVCMHLRSSQKGLAGHVVSEGFLTSYCDDYFFMSMEPMGEITEAIKRSDVIKIYLPIQELTDMAFSGMNESEMN